MSKNVKKSRYSKEEYIKNIKLIFSQNPVSQVKPAQVYAMLDITHDKDKYAVKDVLHSLLEENFIIKASKDAYQLNGVKVESCVGKVVSLTRGTLYIKVEDIDEDIVVEAENSQNALMGDVVNISVSDYRNAKGRIEGHITEVTERSDKKYVGVMSLTKHFGFVEVDSRQMPYDILIPSDHLMDSKNGEKVMVEIIEWTIGSKNPVGKVVEIFGMVGDNDAEMHSILSEFDLPYKFRDEVEQEALKLSDTLCPKEIAKRRDFRDITTFTIDPFDAKDFDDALSVRALPNGNWEIGVHIADVTHYVREGTILDKEATERATSVYLVDRVVPMLPERISNFLCSLRPHEDKFCFSVVFEITDNGEVVDKWYGRTVIHSDARFSYEDAQAIIEGGEGELKDEILTLDRIAKIIRKQRYKNGSIAFERDEPKFELDEKGKPINVYFKKMKDSNQLIEEFMLLANLSVAEFIGKQRGTKRNFVYRIHDKPSAEKFKKLTEFVARFGYQVRADSEKAIGKEINKLLASIKGEKVENLFSILALRTMAKAIYSTENIGHYGLAFDHYTHFTSPIRRFPDMMVHRLLQFYLDGGKNVNKEEYEAMCVHASTREIRATEAERASIKYKMAEFLADKIGQEFIGFITGVTEWGIYVELQDTKIEGMVAVRNIKDDFYQFDIENYRMIGLKSRRILTLGDPVKIKVSRVDLRQKQIDFEIISTINFESGEEKLFAQKQHLKSRVKTNERGRRRKKTNKEV